VILGQTVQAIVQVEIAYNRNIERQTKYLPNLLTQRHTDYDSGYVANCYFIKTDSTWTNSPSNSPSNLIFMKFSMLLRQHERLKYYYINKLETQIKYKNDQGYKRGTKIDRG
jgi:hypothetical protein